MLVVGLCWLLVFVAGCSGSEPSPAPTSRHPGTAATSTPTSPSADPTDIAAAAAIAAVNKLYAEYNAMLKSGSSASYRQTFTRACNFCLQDANTVDRISSEGQTISGGIIRTSRLRVALAEPRLAVVEGDQTDSPAVVRKAGNVVTRYAGGTTSHFTWRVELVDDAWLITDVSPVR